MIHYLLHLKTFYQLLSGTLVKIMKDNQMLVSEEATTETGIEYQIEGIVLHYVQALNLQQ